MQVSIDNFESFEAVLKSEFAQPMGLSGAPLTPAQDSADMGFRIATALTDDLSLDAGVLDLDDLY